MAFFDVEGVGFDFVINPFSLIFVLSIRNFNVLGVNSSCIADSFGPLVHFYLPCKFCCINGRYKWELLVS